MSPKTLRPPADFKKVAAYYDKKKDDFNRKLAPDDYVHHHNGICNPDATFPKDLTEEEILKTLHKQENDLVHFATKYLGNIKPSMYGLDAGCGRGGSSFLIHRKFGCNLLGINVSSYQVTFAQDVARRMGVANKVKFGIEDMSKTSFADRTFDFIWACESTEHMPDLSKTFSEFRRIIKPDRTLVLLAWCTNPNHPEGPSIAKQVNKAYVTSIHSQKEYLEIPKKLGWKIVKTVDLTSRAAPYWRLRDRSKNKPGTESFMARGFSTGALKYHLFQYRSY